MTLCPVIGPPPCRADQIEPNLVSIAWVPTEPDRRSRRGARASFSQVHGFGPFESGIGCVLCLDRPDAEADEELVQSTAGPKGLGPGARQRMKLRGVRRTLKAVNSRRVG